jgi:hypothetical protein
MLGHFGRVRSVSCDVSYIIRETVGDRSCGIGLSTEEMPSSYSNGMRESA